MPRNEPGLQSKQSHSEQTGRFSSPEFDLILKPSTGKVQVTVAVSKKVAPRAVDRNRIKRIIKEALRKGDLAGSPVFFVKKNIAGLKSYQVEELIFALRTPRTVSPRMNAQKRIHTFER